LCHRLSLKQLK